MHLLQRIRGDKSRLNQNQQKDLLYDAAIALEVVVCRYKPLGYFPTLARCSSLKVVYLRRFDGGCWHLCSLRTGCTALLASFVATAPIPVSSGVGERRDRLEIRPNRHLSHARTLCSIFSHRAVYSRACARCKVLSLWPYVGGSIRLRNTNANVFIAFYNPLAIFALIKLPQK